MQDPIDKIREADLKADLFALAGDAMRGREGGTLDEMTASVWVAEHAREAGLLPAGDNGTYFQFFPLERFRVSASSTVTLGGKSLRMGRDVSPTPRCSPTSTRRSIVAAERQRRRLDAQGRGARRPLRAGAARRLPGSGGRATRLAAFAPGCAACSARSATPAPAAIVAIVPDEVGSVERAWPSRSRAARTGWIPTARRSGACAPRGMPLLYVRESALGGAARRRRQARRLDLDRHLHVSVGQHHRQGAGQRPAARATSTCSSARTGPRRRALPVARRFDLERRRRQRDDERRAARHRARV